MSEVFTPELTFGPWQSGIGTESTGKIRRLIQPTSLVVAVALVTANGVLKHSNIVLTGNNLTETGLNADGNYQLIAANAAKIGQRYFEGTMVTFANGHTIGVCDGSIANFSADIVTPGTSITKGVVLALNGAGTFTIHKNGVGTAGGALSSVAGNILGVKIDIPSDTVTFFQMVSGTPTQIDLAQGSCLMGTWGNVTAFVGGQGSEQNTMNFAGPPVRALDSGFLMYGG